jgi:membrane-associated protein
MTAGVLFGQIPWVKSNLTLIALGIVVVSLLPVALHWLQARRVSAA